MNGFDFSEDQRPLTYINGRPVYVTTLLVAIHVAAFIALAFITAAGADWLVAPVIFRSRDILDGAQLWRCVTYAFVHPTDQGIWFAIEMLLLFQFGREVERFLGRNVYLRLYVSLMLIAPVALTVAGLVFPTAQAGSGGLHFAMFIAFATLYPHVAIVFGVAARWVAGILFTIYTLQAFAFHDVSLLISLWVSAAAAITFVLYARGQITLPTLPNLRKRSKLRVLPPPPRRAAKIAVAEDSTMQELDALLDKIARSGMASLTAAERAKLDKAREALMKKESEPR